MSELATLIRERMAEHGWSFRDVARQTGERISSSTVHALAGGKGQKDWKHMPTPATLEALADGLNLPVQQVRRAAAADAGVRLEFVPNDGSPLQIVAAVMADLEPDQRAELARMAEVYWERFRHEGKGRTHGT